MTDDTQEVCPLCGLDNEYEISIGKYYGHCPLCGRFAVVYWRNRRHFVQPQEWQNLAPEYSMFV